MESSFYLFLYFLTGLTLALASVFLFIGLQKSSEKSYLILGIMGACISVYYLLYSPTSIAFLIPIKSKVALFFLMASFTLLPWYLSHYTSYFRKRSLWLLAAIMAVSYVVLLFTKDFSAPVIWNIIAHIALCGIIIYGFKAALFHFKNGKRASGKQLFFTLTILTIISIDDFIRVYLREFYPFDGLAEFLLLDYFLIFFLIMMGIKLTQDMQQKTKIEKSLNQLETRWSTLLEKVQLIVIGVNKEDQIYYVNPAFSKLTEFKSEEVIGKNYEFLLPKEEREPMRNYSSRVSANEQLPFYQSKIRTKSGEEKTVNWEFIGNFDENQNFTGTGYIGSDITDQRLAFEQIKFLKSRLEEENILLKAEKYKMPVEGELIGKSDALKYVLQRSMQVASTDSTVLLEGETGVGKELIANLIQKNSLRATKPFVKINCAAIPAPLLESELFGHVKGAFTGADKNKRGLVEMANGGTLFLDEIGEFPLELQPKLLRFLQEGEFKLLGSEVSKKVDVRIITATNRELLKEIEEGRFRNDLYYRLYVYPITIPPLRYRTEDIPELVDVIVKRVAKKNFKPISKISKLVIDELKKYNWPGNIRELENILERAVIVCNTDTIKIKDLSPVISNFKEDKTSKQNKLQTLEDVERNHILITLKQIKWQVHGPSGAAEILGINPSTLRSRIKKLNIVKP